MIWRRNESFVRFAFKCFLPDCLLSHLLSGVFFLGGGLHCVGSSFPHQGLNLHLLQWQCGFLNRGTAKSRQVLNGAFCCELIFCLLSRILACPSNAGQVRCPCQAWSDLWVFVVLSPPSRMLPSQILGTVPSFTLPGCLLKWHLLRGSSLTTASKTAFPQVFYPVLFFS